MRKAANATHPDQSVTISVRLPPTIELSLNASRPWLRAGFASRNAWLVSLIANAIDMRTVPTQIRFDRKPLDLPIHRRPRRGQL
jgi:hypothetical protein